MGMLRIRSDDNASLQKRPALESQIERMRRDVQVHGECIVRYDELRALCADALPPRNQWEEIAKIAIDEGWSFTFSPIAASGLRCFNHDTGPLGAIMVFFCDEAAVAHLDAIAGSVSPPVKVKGGTLKSSRAIPAEIRTLSVNVGALASCLLAITVEATRYWPAG